MLTQDLIDAQESLERRQITGGLNRLRKQTKDLEEKAYASATDYGRASIDTLLPHIINRIQEKFDKASKSATGYQRELLSYIMALDAESSAAIACKRTFDKVFSFKKDDNKVTKIAEAIGSAVESELQMRHYEQTAPGLLKVLKDNYWHQSKGTQQKLVSIQTVINRYDIEKWQSWGSQRRIKVGGWLLDVICDVSGWFTRYTVQRKKKDTYIVPTEEFIKNKEEIIKIAELFSPLTWPMIIPPRDWTNLESGGYYLNALTKCHEMVRRGPPLSIQGRKPLAFLNKIQRVGYRLNPFIIDVANVFDKRGIEVGKFRPVIEHHLPNKPLNIDSDSDAKQKFRRESAEVWDKRSQEFRKSCRTRMTMNAIAEFRDKERFYIPWSFDYRGRVYPIPSFLTPQDSDFGKSLIRFADESLVTPEAEQWLSFHIATCFGLDKEPRDKRYEWTFHNRGLIENIAKDPIATRSVWEQADEPWQFLAACDEYWHCCILKDKDTTGLPVAIDATCSGLQILAGLAMDKKTAQLVNVLPAERPQDAYAKVAGVAKWNCPDSVKDILDRKVVKRVVMTIPYNAKPHSNRSYIRDALREKGVEISQEDLTATVSAVRNAMQIVVPGPMAVMKWIETEVTKAIKRGETEIRWVTPSGFHVTQRLMKPECSYIHLQLLGKCKVWAATGDSDEVDLMHHKNATAPNLIHSLDASLLHFAATRFDNPIALIHDSVLCRATDMTVLNTIVKETYMHLFAEHDYLTKFAQQIGAETENLPIIGDLEPSQVIDSNYFFC